MMPIRKDVPFMFMEVPAIPHHQKDTSPAKLHRVHVRGRGGGGRGSGGVSDVFGKRSMCGSWHGRGLSSRVRPLFLCIKL